MRWPEPGRTLASSGGEYHAGGLARDEALDVGRLWARASERVDRDTDRAPPIASPRPIHSAVPVPASRPPPTVAAKCAKIGAIMNAATARIQLDDREHPREAGGGQREAGDKQRGRDGRAEPNAGQPRAEERGRFARRHVDAEDRDPSREEEHADQRQIVDRTPGDDDAEQKPR